MMEEHPKEEMESESKCSSDSENSSTSSWILLSTDEEFKAPGGTQENIEDNLPTEKNEDTATTEELKECFVEDAILNINDPNNKSDAESDGISIISESELYLSRSDDDCSTNSSDENTVDNIKKNEPSKFKYTHVDELVESQENSSDIEILPNHLSFNSDDLTQQTMTDSNYSEETNDSNVTDQDDSKQAKIDKKITKKELLNFFQTIFKCNSMCFIGTLILAITVSHISSKLAQDSLDQNDIQQDDHNEVTNDEIVTRFFEYDGDIYVCSSVNHDFSDEQCVKRPRKDIKQTKRHKPPEIKIFGSGNSKNSDPNIKKNEKISSENSDNNGEMKYKNKKKSEQSKSSESFKTLEKHKQKYQEEYSELSEDKLLHEEKEIENWRDTLRKEEKRLKEWETRLLQTEQGLHEKNKIKNDIFKNRENKYKLKNAKNKEKFKKIDEFKSDKSYQDKKYSNKYKSEGQKKNDLLKTRSQKIKTMKDKTDKYKRKIPVTYDAKLKKLVDIRKKNKTNRFDDYNTITGEWYLNLNQGRNEKREKGNKAGWWFDRANFRKIKRNKAYWYFQYMFNREDLRYASSQNTRNV